MNLERFIEVQRKAVTARRAFSSGDPRNAGTYSYANNQYAAGMESVLNALEEYVRQANRVHQDRT